MENGSAIERPPAFVGGFRSGSTLLINYLGLHPEISAIYETRFLAHLLRVARLLQDEDGRSESERQIVARWTGNPGLSRAEAVDVMIRTAIEDIELVQRIREGLAPYEKAPYERYALGAEYILWTAAEAMEAIEPFVRAVRAASPAHTLIPLLAPGICSLFVGHAKREGKSYWINKTPELPRFQPELRQMLGRVKFIQLIRDGRDVVHSCVKHYGWSAAAGAWSWKTLIDEARAQAAPYPEDYLELRYEALVVDHEGALKKVLDFLEIDGDPRQIIAAQERHAPGSTSRLEAERRAGRWRFEMSANDRAVFKDAANDLLVSLGYARDSNW